ncbi:MBL fold metallo-hydrolase [Candidatus Micrarchaeota archaeon]|nr:MBL fold metallo-hydrolase [Candidatus Micrarchaeota archaeon]
MVIWTRGSTSNEFRLSRGILANGYIVGDLAVDAPENMPPRNVKKVIITHAHCDHIASLAQVEAEIYASVLAKKAIEENDELSLLCSTLYFDVDFRGLSILPLKDGDVIKQGDFNFQIIETPGHSEDSICIYLEEKGFLFAGDTIFPDFMLPNTDLPTSSIIKLKDSYEKLLTLDIRKIFPGHGMPFEEKDYIKSLLRQF